MFKKSEQHNPNYLAKIIKLSKPVKHPIETEQSENE